MNNMTGDPNQENRPSVFAFEPYPSLHVQPIDWSRIPVEPPLPGQFNPCTDYSPTQLGNFSFCTTETPAFAQFPFPSGSKSPSLENHGFNTNLSHLRCKRKTDPPDFKPSKQHITEEKMAEHMSKLHISSETATSSKETATDRTRRLYMCEEMRKLQSDTILPQSILAKIQRPCTALVLWTPPPRLLPAEGNGNNNEDSAPDHNNLESDMNNMEFDVL